MDLRQHAEFLVEQLLVEERARIRRELLAEIEEQAAINIQQGVSFDDIRETLDRICPERAGEPQGVSGAPCCADEIRCPPLDIVEYQNFEGLRFELVGRDRKVLNSVFASWVEIRDDPAARDRLLERLMTGHATPPAQEAEEPPDTSSPAPRD